MYIFCCKFSHSTIVVFVKFSFWKWMTHMINLFNVYITLRLCMLWVHHEITPTNYVVPWIFAFIVTKEQLSVGWTIFLCSLVQVLLISSIVAFFFLFFSSLSSLSLCWWYHQMVLLHIESTLRSFLINITTWKHKGLNICLNSCHS